MTRLALYEGVGVVLRPGEIYLKGQNRKRFVDALVRNVQRALAGRDDVSVRAAHGRIFVVGADDEDILARLRTAFGVTSYSPVRFCPKEFSAIAETALQQARAAGYPPSATFAVAARRSDKSFGHTSAQLQVEIGARIHTELGHPVCLDDPDLRVGIEVGSHWCFVWTRQIEGPGGLPVGVSDAAMLLLSGGIDSPVAGHLLQKRGVRLCAAYFHAFPYTSDGAKEKVRRLAQVLARRQDGLSLYVVPFAAVQETLRDAGRPDYLVLLYRRAMMRIAAALAAKEKCTALATGENLGQVASQTMANMHLVDCAVPDLVLRPLLTMDKRETIDLARNIGTYDISIEPFDDCCTLFVPEHPQTRGSLRTIEALEDRVDWRTPLDQAVAEAELICL